MSGILEGKRPVSQTVWILKICRTSGSDVFSSRALQQGNRHHPITKIFEETFSFRNLWGINCPSIFSNRPTVLLSFVGDSRCRSCAWNIQKEFGLLTWIFLLDTAKIQYEIWFSEWILSFWAQGPLLYDLCFLGPERSIFYSYKASVSFTFTCYMLNLTSGMGEYWSYSGWQIFWNGNN